MNTYLKNILDTAIAYVTTDEGAFDDLDTAVSDYLTAVREGQALSYNPELISAVLAELLADHTAVSQEPA